MKIDIWSDIRCPFCYIGKKKFERGLEKFPGKENIEVVWHSFELDPTLITDTTSSIYDYLAERKNITRQQAVQMNNQVTKIAAEVDLVFNIDKSILANSFNDHRLVQSAKKNGLADEAEEALFKAYFTDGANIDDYETLTGIGVSIGLKQAVVRDMLKSNAFSEDVRYDQKLAGDIGINGVPFFVIDNKYAISGAQAPENFLEVLNTAWQEIGTLKHAGVSEGEICSAEGC
ncbi:MAG: DsbA family oxidoreductase [Bacteroidota bacterium]